MAHADDKKVVIAYQTGANPYNLGIANGDLRPDLDVDDALDLLYGPLWLRLLVGHRATGRGGVDRLLDLAWPGLENRTG